MLREVDVGREIPDEEHARADLYGLLAGLLAVPPDETRLAALRTLTGNDTLLGQALADLGNQARVVSREAVDREFHDLFVGLTEGELRPYGSYYLTGFLYEKPLATLRADLERLGIARAADASEPEDHIAAMMEVMHGLIRGTFGTVTSLEVQKRFFDAHLWPLAPRFFADLEAAANARLYRPVGRVGRVFMAIEREAFDMFG